MLRSIVSLILATAAPALAANSELSVDSWWEKITVTMNHDGQAEGCRYETSTASTDAKDCKVVGASAAAAAPLAKDQYATITFERRFSPGGAPPAESVMVAGDKLLGRQVMSLAIDGAGKVSGCTVIAASGDTGLTYRCEDVAAEHFATGAPATAAAERQGFMTILVYGHTEHAA